MNSLIHDQIAFHNVTALTPAPGGGMFCHRFPPELRSDTSIPFVGQTMARMAAKCELRCHAERPARVFLSSTEDSCIDIYRGDLQVERLQLKAHRIRGVALHAPPIEAAADPAVYPKRFPRDLWRICCHGAELIYHGVDAMGGELRPPSDADLPATRWLAYGSSITMAKRTNLGYVEVAAEELGWDAFNLGMGGACHMETSICDWIAARDDWDVATFELGINMIGTFEPEEFERRARHLLTACLAARSDTRILLIDLVRCSADARMEADLGVRHAAAYRAILDRLEQDLDHGGRLQRYQGLDWVPDYRGFKADLVHPADAAYFRMGQRMAERLRLLTGTAAAT